MLVEKIYNYRQECARSRNLDPEDGDAKSVRWIVKKISSLSNCESKWVCNEAMHDHAPGLLN